MKLDFSLKTPTERINYVEKILQNEKVNPQGLKYMTDYILFVGDKNQTKKERKEKSPLITNNREKTINKRQISLEELITRLENGEDGLYALINNDKNQKLDQKEKITEQDIAEIPGLVDQLNVIEQLQKQFQSATGQKKFILKKQIIETWQQIYILKSSIKGGIARGHMSNQVKTIAHMPLNGDYWLDENDVPQTNDPINIFNPAHVSFLLCYYSQLKQELIDDFNSDLKYLLMVLEDTAEKALKEKQPVLWDILIYKIDGKTNEEIKNLILEKHNVSHKEQYYSTLWRQRIPKLISEQAKKDFIYWYFSTQIYGEWKTCSRCGETKPAHEMFYSKNTSRDGWYSLCKQCRK